VSSGEMFTTTGTPREVVMMKCNLIM